MHLLRSLVILDILKHFSLLLENTGKNTLNWKNFHVDCFLFEKQVKLLQA